MAKLQCLTEEKEETYGSSYREFQNVEVSRNRDFAAYRTFRDILLLLSISQLSSRPFFFA